MAWHGICGCNRKVFCIVICMTSASFQVLIVCHVIQFYSITLLFHIICFFVIYGGKWMDGEQVRHEISVITLIIPHFLIGAVRHNLHHQPSLIITTNTYSDLFSTHSNPFFSLIAWLVHTHAFQEPVFL